MIKAQLEALKAALRTEIKQERQRELADHIQDVKIKLGMV